MPVIAEREHANGERFVIALTTLGFYAALRGAGATQVDLPRTSIGEAMHDADHAAARSHQCAMLGCRDWTEVDTNRQRAIERGRELAASPW